MSALAQRIEEDLQSRAANDDDINGGLWTRTKYAYAGNNPLTNVDPSGFSFWKSLSKALGWINLIATFFFPPIGWINAATNGFITGFLISGGDIKAGLISGITAGLMNGIHGLEIGRIARATLHGIVGGGGSVAQGGRFKNGFLSAFGTGLGAEAIERHFGEAGTGDGLQQAKRVIASAILGGTISEIAGGRFGNGAITAAFARMFNEEAQSGVTVSAKVLKFVEAKLDSEKGLKVAVKMGKTMSVKVDAEGKATFSIKDGASVDFDASQDLEGAGLSKGVVDVKVTTSADGVTRVSGTVEVPQFSFLGLKFGGYTTLRLDDTIKSNSGYLGHGARAPDLYNQRLRNQISCGEAGGDNCETWKDGKQE